MMRIVVCLLVRMIVFHLGVTSGDRVADLSTKVLATGEEVATTTDSCKKPPTLADTNLWRGKFEVPLWIQSMVDVNNPNNLFYIVGAGGYSSNPEKECTPLDDSKEPLNLNRGDIKKCRMRAAMVAQLATEASQDVVHLERWHSPDSCILTGTGCVPYNTALDSVIVKWFKTPLAVRLVPSSDLPNAAGKIPDIKKVVRVFTPAMPSEEWSDNFVVHAEQLQSGKEKWYAVAVKKNGDGLCYLDRVFACDWTASFWTGSFIPYPTKAIWYGYTEKGKRGEEWECQFEAALKT